MKRILITALLGALTGACADVTSPTADFGSRVMANTTTGLLPAPYRSVKVCKTGGPATFEISVPGSEPWQESLLNGECRWVYTWDGVWTATTTPVTVTELVPAGYQLDSIVKDSIVVSTVYRVPTITGSLSAVGSVNGQKGAVLHFYNSLVPPPPPVGLAGCTPGYWRQAHHFDSWPAPYSPQTLFSDVFADAFPGKTLLEVVKLGGGRINALGRHTVAALLSSGSVDYGMTPAQVISAFNSAFASGDYATLHAQFEGYNERGCSLG